MTRDGHRVVLDNHDNVNTFKESNGNFILAGKWYYFKLVYFKGLVEVWKDGVKAFSYTEKSYDDSYNQGFFAFRTTYNVHAQLDSVEISKLKSSTAGMKWPVNNNKQLKSGFNFQNPVSGNLVVNYWLTNPEHTNLSVFNAGGQLLKSLVNKTQQAGNYCCQWDPNRSGAGIYILQFNAGDFADSKRVTVLR
jgi:hypothetical protein